MPGPKSPVSTRDHLEHQASSLAQWFARDAQWLHGLLRRNFRLAPAEADDLVQDTWLRLIRKPPAEISHPRALLSHIALNLFRDSRRREQRRVDHLHLVATNERHDMVPGALVEQEADYLLERIILDLPQPLRDVFMLSRFGRMTNRDIAEHLGIAVKTVEWRIGKALDLCMSKLQG